MGKVEELEKIQELRANGGITEKEFEIEKYKILNSNDTKGKKKLKANNQKKRNSNSKHYKFNNSNNWRNCSSIWNT